MVSTKDLKNLINMSWTMVPYRQKKISHQTKTSKNVYKHMVLQRNEMKSENIAMKWKRAYDYDTWATQCRII